MADAYNSSGIVNDQSLLAFAAVDDGVVNFLKNWLVNHIKASDFQYIDVLKD